MDESPFSRIEIVIEAYFYDGIDGGKKNDLRTMKRILYDMGPLTLVRWPLSPTLGEYSTIFLTLP